MASRTYPTSRTKPSSSAAALINTGNTQLVGWNLINPASTTAYLKFYNAASAGDVTVGSSTVVRTLMIPAYGTCLLSNEDKFQLAFNLGMVVALTSGAGDDDSSAPPAGCIIELFYNNSVN